MSDEELKAKVELLEGKIQAIEETLDAIITASAEEDFEEERSQWIEECRERAAERRRTS